MVAGGSETAEWSAPTDSKYSTNLCFTAANTATAPQPPTAPLLRSNQQVRLLENPLCPLLGNVKHRPVSRQPLK